MHIAPPFARSSRDNSSLHSGSLWRRVQALGLGLALFLPGFAPVDMGPAYAQAPRRTGALTRPAKSDAEWGEAVGGLRTRVIAVAPDTDEQKPDFATAKRAAQYDHPDDGTILV